MVGGKPQKNQTSFTENITFWSASRYLLPLETFRTENNVPVNSQRGQLSIFINILIHVNFESRVKIIRPAKNGQTILIKNK